MQPEITVMLSEKLDCSDKCLLQAGYYWEGNMADNPEEMRLKLRL